MLAEILGVVDWPERWVAVSSVATVVLTISNVCLVLYLARTRTKRDAVYECDRLYMEIQKCMLEYPELLRFYEVGPQKESPRFLRMSEQDKRLWLFAEMNYFHFAFVHREHQRGAVDTDYWKLYENWLTQLKDSPIFLDVHEVNRGLFEAPFREYMDEKLGKR